MADPYAQQGGEGEEEGPLSMNAMLKEVQLMADKFKAEDDEVYVSPYAYLEKAAVLQEARCFNDSVVVRENPRKCCTVIAQLLHLQNTGQFLSSTEATEGECILWDDKKPAHYVLVWRRIYLFLHCIWDDIYHVFGVG